MWLWLLIILSLSSPVGFGAPSTLQSAKERIQLARTYLPLGQFHEAFLLIEEIRVLNSSNKLPEAVMIEAALVKAQSMVGLKQFDRASKLLDETAANPTIRILPRLKGESSYLQMKLKTRACSEFPSNELFKATSQKNSKGNSEGNSMSSYDELQIRNQYERRGTCLQESLLLIQQILKTDQIQFLKSAAGLGQLAFENYRQACLKPPITSNIPDSKKKRTSVELEKYRSELIQLLLSDYQKTVRTGIDLLKSWNSTSSDSEKQIVTALIDNLEHSLTESSWPQK